VFFGFLSFFAIFFGGFSTVSRIGSAYDEYSHWLIHNVGIKTKELALFVEMVKKYPSLLKMVDDVEVVKPDEFKQVLNFFMALCTKLLFH